MLKMRLQRVGRKHEPAFRLVLTDSKNSTKSGRFKEILGSYDPRKSTDLLKVDRIKHWLSMGVTPTDSVHNFLVTHNVIGGKKKNVLPKKTPIVKESPEVETPTDIAPQEDAATAIAETMPETAEEPETASEPEVEAPPEPPVEPVVDEEKAS